MYNKINIIGAKKIGLIIASLLLLASCSNTENNIKIKNNSSKIEKQEIVKKEENIENKNIENDFQEKKVSVWDIKNNLSKLEDTALDNNDLRMLNDQVVFLYNDKIKKEAIEKKDLKICDKLDKNFINSCKVEVIKSMWDTTKCDSLKEENTIKSCKNEINRNLANKKLDTKYCDELIDDSEEKIEIKSCKNRVLNEQAIKNLDLNACKKISEKNEVEMCEELVKMEEEMKKQEELIKAEEETDINIQNNPEF